MSHKCPRTHLWITTHELRNADVRNLPGCWPTRTCRPPLSWRRPPGSPSACLSAPLGRGWGIWLVLCQRRKVVSVTEASSDWRAFKGKEPKGKKESNAWDAQFVHEVVAQVLRDVLVPPLPGACGREGRRGGEVSHGGHGRAV